MILWAIAWFWMRFEFMIDWGRGGLLTIDWLPSIPMTISEPDEEGYRRYALGLNFLIFSMTFSYYYPMLFKYDNEGEFMGTLSFPECTIMQVD